MTSSLRLAALLVSLAPLAARAAEQGPTHPAPAAAKPAAEMAQKPGAAELARLIVPKESWTTSMGMLAQGAQQQMQSHPGSKLTFPADFAAKVRAEVESVLPYEELISMHARELSAAYSEKELADLLAFHRSPTGQKFLRVMPEVSGKVEAATQARFQKKMPEVMTRLSSGLKHPDAKAGDSAKPAGAGAKPAAAATKM